MTTFLIDDSGEFWDANAWQLRSRYGVRLSNTAFTDFLIRNQGCIALTPNDGNLIIKVAPIHVTQACFVAFTRWITDQNPRRIAIKWFDGKWNHELIIGAPAARKRIAGLRHKLRSAISPDYLSQPRALSSLERSHPLFDLLDAWQTNSGRLHPSKAPRLFEERLSARYVVVQSDRSDGSLRLSDIGNGYASMFPADWRKKLIGADLERHHDLRYARSVANCWRSAILASEPTLTDIDAVQCKPKTRNRYRMPYSRITLPVGDGSQLLCASFLDSSIDLRS
ncbi:MAG: hypothetical protein AAGB04_21440 [Pseudomonadota bacterium]